MEPEPDFERGRLRSERSTVVRQRCQQLDERVIVVHGQYMLATCEGVV